MNEIGSDHDTFSYSVPMIRYPITKMVSDFQPNKELEKKWEIALNNKIPMYFYLNEDDRNVYVIAEYYDNQALAVVKNNLIISKMLSFRFIWAAFTTLYEVDKYIFLNFLLNGGANIPLASIYYIGSAIEFHKEVIKFAETSYDCSKMVDSIEFQRLEWSMPKFSSRVKFIRQKEYIKAENQHIFIKYETSNVHNSNLFFYIFIWKEVKAETIHRFRIQKFVRASIEK
uniref:Uncharacterized protein n=1 Tax=Meloidogyne javanica TaxID=6303 RepID=A0A915LTW9_MELJA